ncbi:leucine-rich repeat domain-containing protein [Rhodobium gokarnense]|uniref:Leucine-rich repeat (LRR) protein n=1 Tax=Rhodobium gokarnense TaxID=364296 RepID=A0ABT3HCI1_9HYPH|nr:leucine-rich repeat domain-containing protein [Rhodobium gokarnense]MCW2308112.1 Leucine-rich repeat (LRR) protein [Rhodobium gokarnense]
MALDYITPNANLARELHQVAKEAALVADRLRGINLMPRKFPEEAVNELCLSLLSLKDGTAEGCVEPLNFARYMLPLVRRDHFYIDGEEPENLDEEDTFFIRDSQLDQAMTRLYGAVGTALDEYRAQAQNRYDDYVGAEESFEFEDDGTFAEISDASRDVSENAEAEHQNLSEWSEPDSKKAENLRRQIQDSANIAHSVQSQIRIRPIVARWYESAGKALRKLPDVIISTADVMRAGIDVGQIWVEEWSAFRKRLRHLAYDQMRGLADALQATGERLKKHCRPAQNTIERQRDPEVMAAERRVKEILLAGDPLPKEIAQKAEIIVFRKRDGTIKRSEDLLLLTNVRRLAVGNAGLKSSIFSALGQLSNLTNLVVSANKVSDISALGQLSNLTSLAVNAAKVSDISALGQLSNLTSLAVNANNVSDISALGQLSNLTSLSVTANNVSDISALGQLSNLTSLSVNANNVSDISALGQLSNLTRLAVHANNASDISALGQLSNLTSLSVNANNVSDISALGQLSNLTSLSLHANNISDISALGQLSNLTSLSVYANNVSDISALRQLSNLTSLSVRARRLDLSDIVGSESLTSLRISDVRHLDLAPLSKLKNLSELSLANVNYRNSRYLDSVKIKIVGNSKDAHWPLFQSDSPE